MTKTKKNQEPKAGERFKVYIVVYRLMYILTRYSASSGATLKLVIPPIVGVLGTLPSARNLFLPACYRRLNAFSATRETTLLELYLVVGDFANRLDSVG